MESLDKNKLLAFQQSWLFLCQRRTFVVVWRVKYALYSFISLLFLCYYWRRGPADIDGEISSVKHSALDKPCCCRRWTFFCCCFYKRVRFSFNHWSVVFFLESSKIVILVYSCEVTSEILIVSMTSHISIWCLPDIDECNENLKNNCSHLCINSPGSYYCNCPNGFQMSQNNKTCKSPKVFQESFNSTMCLGK